MKYLIPVLILFVGSCSFFGTVTAKRGTSYLIETDDKSYVFVVANIKREQTENTLLEGIEYQLYLKENENDDVLMSFIKYRRTKTGKHSYSLHRIEGTDEIVFGNLNFTWSYGSEDHIYLYLKDGVKIKKKMRV